MRKTAILIHINVLRSVTPLTGGYLKAYARTEPALRSDWDIELYAAHVRTPASEIISHVVRRKPDVVGFSVYTWNVRLVQRLLPALQRILPPETQFLLGGVEVINLGQHYVERSWENAAVCNGEGERCFRDYLLELGQERPDMRHVPGISFWRDGSWITNDGIPRIRDLSEIPSPYLSDVLDLRGVEAALYETNRGCPFQCEFCFWGGAIGERVNRFPDDRIRDEIEYIARQGIRTLYICDANFGMLARDVDIAEHIVQMKRSHRYPDRVAFSSAKNSPDRVERIAKLLVDGDLLSAQAISLQTMNDRALDVARRGNIKPETYLRLQTRLNEWNVSSNVELIWPLPGETLESFKQGIDQLCAMGAQAFQLYPLLWLNNIGYRQRTAELGVVTMQEDDPAGGGEIVIQTKEVSYAQYVEGLLFASAVFLLYDCRGLYATMQVLRHYGIASFRDVCEAFAAWMNGSSGNAITELWQRGQREPDQLLQYIWRGIVGDAVLHSHRKDFDRMLAEFTAGRTEWYEQAGPERAPVVRAAVEFDILNRPYPFVQTPLETGIEPQLISIKSQRRGTWVIESPFDLASFVEKIRHGQTADEGEPAARRVEVTIDHRPGQVFRMTGRSDEDFHWHLYRIMRGMRNTEARYAVSQSG